MPSEYYKRWRREHPRLQIYLSREEYEWLREPVNSRGVSMIDHEDHVLELCVVIFAIIALVMLTIVFSVLPSMAKASPIAAIDLVIVLLIIENRFYWWR